MVDVTLPIGPDARLPYRVHAQDASPGSPLVFDSPHSWPHWPADAPRPVAAPAALRTSCDTWVDAIWAEAIGSAAPLLAARFHRAYIDANRARDDIDPELLEGPWPGTLDPSDKSRRGFGLLRRLALPAVPMYDRPLAIADVEHRLRRCYDPYHAKLAELIAAAHRRHGVALHIDCHSMKSVGNAMNEDDGKPRPDFVVSDLDGRCADALLVRWIATTLAQQGYRVQVNDPYRGGELIRRHGRPVEGRHSVQIEINRALYMDEERFVRTPGYAPLVAHLRQLVRQLPRALAFLPGRAPPD